MCFFKKRKERKERELAAKKNENIKQEKSVNNEKKASDKPVENKPIEKKPVEQKPVKKESTKKQQYHVSQNKDEKSEFFKQWRVRKSGSDKVIKYFKTQKEAIVYAEELAKNNDTTVVIHKVDGSIRKQDYSDK